MRFMFKRRSLKWRLVSRFSLALAAVMVVFYVGLIALIVAGTSDATPVDDTIKFDIAASIHLDGDRLVLRPTERVAEAIRDHPHFWIVARDAKGREVEVGERPPGLRSVLENLDIISALDVRVNQDSPMTAVFAMLDTEVGLVKAVFGGKSAPGSVLQYMVRTLHVIYLPTILIPLFLAIVIIPLVVNSSMKSMKRITALASQIDVNRAGVRLPTDDLVEEIAPLVKTINAALARVDTDIAAKERFLADAAHELRTPIAILRTRIEGYGDTEQSRRLLLDVARVGAVAEQLLDLQRFAVAPVLSDTDLVSLSGQVVADLAPLAINEGYELGLETDARKVVVQGDRLSIERAVSNLVRNAIEHAGNRGQITVRVHSNAVIEVADDGAGIAEDQHEKIFDPFFRSKPKPIGAGLGLSLVRKIARLHGGDAVSVPTGNGALFRLTLGGSVGKPNA